MARNKLKTAPFAIIGLGKLGGAELNYGSDLDITFVTHPTARDLSASQRLAALSGTQSALLKLFSIASWNTNVSPDVSAVFQPVQLARAFVGAGLQPRGKATDTPPPPRAALPAERPVPTDFD